MPFCILMTCLVLEQEIVMVTFIVLALPRMYLIKPEQKYRVNFLTSRKVRRVFNESGSGVQFIGFIYLYSYTLSSRILSPCLLNGIIEIIDKMKTLADAYPAAYQTLHQAKPVTCSATDDDNMPQYFVLFDSASEVFLLITPHHSAHDECLILNS